MYNLQLGVEAGWSVKLNAEIIHALSSSSRCYVFFPRELQVLQ